MRKSYREVPWKRNLRKVPAELRATLETWPNNTVVVGCVKRISAEAVAEGTYAHLGLRLGNGGLIYPERIVPDPEMGRYSKRNREGWVLRRPDLPKVYKTFWFESPNFGDWSKGSHTVVQQRKVYQRDYIDPVDAALRLEPLVAKGKAGETIIKFWVDIPLSRASPTFETDLLFWLNVLQ